MFNSSHCKPLSDEDKYQVVLNGKTRKEIWDHYGVLATTLSSSFVAAMDNLTPFTTTDRKVAKCLAAHQGRNVDTFVSIDLIAIETRLSRRSVEASLKHLTELEVLTSYKRDPQSKIIHRRIDIDAILSVYEEQINRRLKHPAPATNVAYPNTSKGCKIARQQPAVQEHSTVIFGGPGQAASSSFQPSRDAFLPISDMTQCAENFGDSAENCTHDSAENCGHRARVIYNNTLNQPVLNQSVINQPVISHQETTHTLYEYHPLQCAGAREDERGGGGQSKVDCSNEGDAPCQPVRNEVLDRPNESHDQHHRRAQTIDDTTRKVYAAPAEMVQPTVPPKDAQEVLDYIHSQGFTGMTYAQASNWYKQKRKDDWQYKGRPIGDWRRMALAYCRGCLKLKEHEIDEGERQSSGTPEETTMIQMSPEYPQPPTIYAEAPRPINPAAWLWNMPEDQRRDIIGKAIQDIRASGREVPEYMVRAMEGKGTTI